MLQKISIIVILEPFFYILAIWIKHNRQQINESTCKLFIKKCYCVKNNDQNFVKYLLLLKADVNLKCLNGDTALHFAFKNRNYEIIIMLIESNGDLNILNEKGQTPLAYGDKNLL